LWHDVASRIDASYMHFPSKVFSTLVTFILVGHPLLHAECPIDHVIVNGTVEHAPANAKVRVQLIYPKRMAGDAGDITVQGETFRLPVDFLTQSRGPIINGAFGKCTRKPRTVVVTLIGGGDGREYDRVVLDFAKEFKMADSTTYILRSAVRLETRH
jgi:hypothetical protein